MWENALRIKNFRASNTACLCSIHFTEYDYFGRSKYPDRPLTNKVRNNSKHQLVFPDAKPQAKSLRKSAVPSVFSFTKSKSENPVTLEHQHCLEKRSQRKLLYDQQLQPLNSHPATRTRSLTPAVGCEEEIVTKVSPIGRTLETNSVHEYILSKSTQVDLDHNYVIFGNVL